MEVPRKPGGTEIIMYFKMLFLMVQQPLLGQRLIIQTSLSHSDTPYSVGLLWTSDQSDAETST